MPLINSNESGIDSGSEWLGNVPFSWSMVLLSQVVSQVKNKNSDLSEKNLLSLSYGKIKRKPIDTTEGLLPASFDGYNIIEANDIVLRLTDLQNDHTSLRVGISTEKGIITSAYITMRPKNSKTAKFLYYLLHTFDVRKGFYGMGSGVHQGLNYGEVKRLKIPFPAEDEQVAIANFLDNEIMRVDSIISEAKASIEEYKCWKASIIYEAVTKGLDPSVEMKDSGVEWIGKIPSNWTTKSIKYVMQESKERTATGTEEMLSVTQKYGIIKSSDATISNPSTSTEDWRIVHIGDIVFNKYKAHSGVFFVSPLEGIVTFNYCVYRCFPDNCAKYFEYQFKTPRCIGEFITHMKGVGDSISPLYTTELYKIKVIVPPIEEQLRIVEYLNIQCSKIDAIISEKESLVADLESYKKSLIFEVVTGKRRVV